MGELEGRDLMKRIEGMRGGMVEKNRTNGTNGKEKKEEGWN